MGLYFFHWYKWHIDVGLSVTSLRRRTSYLILGTEYLCRILSCLYRTESGVDANIMKRRQIFIGQLSKSNGFTMIEIIAVLVILGIITAVAAVRMSNTSAYDLASQVEVVKAHLRLAQSRAMSSGSPWGIKFTGPTPTSYYLFQATAPATLVLLPGEDSATVNLTTAKKSALTINTQTITFDAYGSPCAETGTPPAPLTADVTVTTSGGNFIIRKNTGFIQ
jgi:MSHA pilin protein MshC